MQKQVVIFDLYDTLVRVDSMDFSTGLEWTRECFFPDLCTKEELKAYGDISFQKYLMKHREEKEYPLLQEEIPDLFSYFGAELPCLGTEFEYAFLNRAGRFSLCEGVRETLKRLKEKGSRMYVLSNSIYTAAASTKLLEDLGIAFCFDKVFSSADAGVCKPGKAFFSWAEEKIRQQIPDLDLSQAFFCGDRYDLDAVGGVRAGMRTVWINKKNEDNPLALPVKEIFSISELPQIVYADVEGKGLSC